MREQLLIVDEYYELDAATKQYSSPLSSDCYLLFFLAAWLWAKQSSRHSVIEPVFCCPQIALSYRLSTDAMCRGYRIRSWSSFAVILWLFR